MEQWYLLSVILCLALLAELSPEVQAVTVLYQFKRYPYKKKQKQQERKIRAVKTECENREECKGLYGIEGIRCVRLCMSRVCYEELYSHDELEEGEIDVRFNSFKGCILDKMRR